MKPGCLARLLSALVLVAALGPGCAPAHRPAWSEPPPTVQDSPIVVPGALHRFELDIGLSLIVLEDHRLPRVSFGLRTRRGAAQVPVANAGLAQFTTELMKRGAGERDAVALARAVDEIGSTLSVSAGWDSLSVHVAGLSRDSDRLLEILSDVALRPRFEEPEADRTRAEFLAAIARSQDSPNSLERRNTVRALYAGRREGIPLIGSAETVPSLDADLARAFHQHVFLPNDAVFYASGDLDPDDLLSAVGAAFGSWTAGEIPEPPVPLPSPTPTQRRVVVVDKPDLAQTHITMAHEGIARDDPERIAASLMNSVLGGGGFSSRLMRRIRSDAGLTYNVNAGFGMRRGGGVYSVSTFTRVSEARRVIDVILAEVERARSEPPTESELEGARMLAVGGFALALETSDAVLGGLVDLDVYGLPEDGLDTFRSRVRAVTVEDVARQAVRLLHPERFAIVLVGPASALTPQLDGLGPIEVVSP